MIRLEIRYWLLLTGLVAVTFNSLLFPADKSNSGVISPQMDTAQMRSTIDSLIELNVRKIKIINPNDVAYLNQIEDYDKLVFNNWDLKIVKIKNITDHEILYLYPLNPQTQRVKRKDVSQILYADNRFEVFRPLIRVKTTDTLNLKKIEIRDQKKWQLVEVSYIKPEDRLLYKIGDISAEYESVKLKVSSSDLERKAQFIIRKKAANMDGTYVLITDKKIRRSYGDSPSIRLEGIVYKTEND